MIYASLGSISSGTLRTADLLDSFADELEYHVQRNADEWCSDEGRKIRDDYMKLIGDAREWEDQEGDAADLNEIGDELVCELIDALAGFAASYCYFGSHEGDGADYGFWPCMAQIQELPQIDDCDSDKARELGEDCAYVNDHGNVTVFGGDGSVIFELV